MGGHEHGKAAIERLLKELDQLAGDATRDSDVRTRCNGMASGLRVALLLLEKDEDGPLPLALEGEPRDLGGEDDDYRETLEEQQCRAERKRAGVRELDPLLDCMACGRLSEDCSADPCHAVQMDRDMDCDGEPAAHQRPASFGTVIDGVPVMWTENYHPAGANGTVSESQRPAGARFPRAK